jgi:hypothetical protein
MKFRMSLFYKWWAWKYISCKFIIFLPLDAIQLKAWAQPSSFFKWNSLSH